MNSKHKLSDGFTLAEVLVTVLILSILASISIAVTRSEIERAKINSVQMALAGWIQVVQRSALLRRSDQPGQGGCQISLGQRDSTTAAVTSITNGSVLAHVTPEECAPNPDLILEIDNLGNSLINASGPAGATIFTPRGTTIYPSGNTATTLSISITSSPRIRCTRLSGLIGVIELGSGNSGSTCTNFVAL